MAELVDATEAALAWLGSDADLRQLVAGRLAARHKYGNGWSLADPGLTLTPVPGTAPDLDAGMVRMRGDLRAYAPTPARAQAIVNRVRRMCLDFARAEVALPAGITALLYFVVPDDSAEAGFDADIKLDYVRLPIRYAAAMEEV